MESDSIACTHATVPMNEAATQQLLDDNSNLREENQQLKTTFDQFKTDMLQNVEVLERQSTNNEFSLINYKSQVAQDKRKLEKKVKQISDDQKSQSLVIYEKMNSLRVDVNEKVHKVQSESKMTIENKCSSMSNDIKMLTESVGQKISENYDTLKKRSMIIIAESSRN